MIAERQERLLNLVRAHKAAQLEELARGMGVSPSTVRRDLESLAERGLIERSPGGAVYRFIGAPTTALDVATEIRDGDAGPSHPKVGLAERMDEQVASKLAIGKYAAAQVKPQMTVLLDGGSTVIYAASQIVARPIQVVTNSLAIANLFIEDDQVELILIGGSLYPRTGVLVGPIASGCLADLHADLLLFSLAGIYGDEGFNLNLAMAQVEQAMLRQAARSLLLMDFSKFDRKGLAKVCQLSEVNSIVTDSRVTQEWRNRLGERLVVAT